jgi:superfamily II DNA helicase RecQ
LVLAAAESACTEQFLNYAQGLALQQQLDRIIVDECHLTITASSYRPSMALLGWHLRQVPTQTVWLTATLPPALQEQFIQQNRLVRPRVIRESTNRPNIRYLVHHVPGPYRQLLAHAVALAQAYRPQAAARDKLILYCQTREAAHELGQCLGCPVYTTESGTTAEKAALIAG